MQEADGETLNAAGIPPETRRLARERAIRNDAVMEISAVTWLWRGLKGHSVTFSILFASVVLGISIAGSVGQLLRSLGLHWLYVIILPGIAFGWLNSREARWLPDETKRRRIARWIICGAIVLAVIINQIRH